MNPARQHDTNHHATIPYLNNKIPVANNIRNNHDHENFKLTKELKLGPRLDDTCRLDIYNLPVNIICQLLIASDKRTHFTDKKTSPYFQAEPQKCGQGQWK